MHDHHTHPYHDQMNPHDRSNHLHGAHHDVNPSNYGDAFDYQRALEDQNFRDQQENDMIERMQYDQMLALQESAARPQYDDNAAVHETPLVATRRPVRRQERWSKPAPQAHPTFGPHNQDCDDLLEAYLDLEELTQRVLDTPSLQRYPEDKTLAHKLFNELEEINKPLKWLKSKGGCGKYFADCLQEVGGDEWTKERISTIHRMLARSRRILAPHNAVEAANCIGCQPPGQKKPAPTPRPTAGHAPAVTVTAPRTSPQPQVPQLTAQAPTPGKTEAKKPSNTIVFGVCAAVFAFLIFIMILRMF